jgi:prepilin-type N-terminal cleavage/methylation domain-containing protein
MTARGSHRRRGFTLLELSIVLGIISLIAGVGMNMASGALKAADRISTQERLNTIKLALDSFAKTYGFLPCPADRTLTTVSANFGLESRNVAGTNCTVTTPATQGVVLANNAFYGMVPVRTLGLPDNYGGDAWGDKLTYAVTGVLVTDPTAYSTKTGAISMYYGDLTTDYSQTMQHLSKTFTSTGAGTAGAVRVTVPATAPSVGTAYVNGTLYKGSYAIGAVSATQFDLTGSTYTSTDTGTVDWLTQGPNAAYVVVSHGPSGAGAYPFNGSAIPLTKPCNVATVDGSNCGTTGIFYDTAYNDGSQVAEFFDDYIVWGSNDVMRAPAITGLYPSCPTGTGTCEPWCATCATNYPGGGGTVPPPTIASGAVLYKKVITSDSSTCSAACFWGGITTSSTYIKAP